MPGYKGHLTGAIVFMFLVMGTSLLIVDNIFYFFLALLGVSAGGLFPDIDTGSKGRKYFMVGAGVALISTMVAELHGIACFIALLMVFPFCVRHRGIFHSFIFLSILVAGCTFLAIHYFPAFEAQIEWFGLWFYLGICSHLYLDFGWMFLRR